MVIQELMIFYDHELILMELKQKQQLLRQQQLFCVLCLLFCSIFSIHVMGQTYDLFYTCYRKQPNIKKKIIFIYIFQIFLIFIYIYYVNIKFLPNHFCEYHFLKLLEYEQQLYQFPKIQLNVYVQLLGQHLFLIFYFFLN